jgi:hypothetical protein
MAFCKLFFAKANAGTKANRNRYRDRLFCDRISISIPIPISISITSGRNSVNRWRASLVLEKMDLVVYIVFSMDFQNSESQNPNLPIILIASHSISDSADDGRRSPLSVASCKTAESI